MKYDEVGILLSAFPLIAAAARSNLSTIKGEPGLQSDPDKPYMPLQTVTPAMLRRKLGLAGGVNWIDRHAASLDHLRESPRLIITGGRRSGKTREAAELIRRAVSAGLVIPERTYQPGATFSFLDPLDLQEMLQRGGVPLAPMLLFIDDLPAYYSERGLERLKNGLDALAACQQVYVIATGCDEDLTLEHLAWLERLHFRSLHLPDFDSAPTLRLIDSASGIFGLHFEDDLRKAFAKKGDGTPEAILSAFRLLRMRRVVQVGTEQAAELAGKSFPKILAQARSELTESQPAVEFLLGSLVVFRQAQTRCLPDLVIGFASHLWAARKRTMLGGRRIGQLRKALDYLIETDYVTQVDGLLSLNGWLPDQPVHAAEVEKLGEFLEKFKQPYQRASLRRFYGEAEQHAWALYDLGLSYHQHNDYLTARRYYTAALTVFPQAYFYNNRGYTNLQFQHYPEALADYSRAIALDPQLAQAYNNRGVTNDTLNNNEAALADFSRAIDLDARYAQAFYNRGNTRAKLQDYQLALADYSRAVDLDPAFTGALNNRGSIRAKRREFAEAVADYTRALELEPANLMALYNRGVAQVELKNFDAALADYCAAVDINPKDDNTLYNIASLYAQQSDAEQAIHWLKRAIKIEHSWAEVARSDTDFNTIRANPDFRELLGTY